MVSCLLRRFSNNLPMTSKNTHKTIALLGLPIAFFKIRFCISLFKDIGNLSSFKQKLEVTNVIRKISVICFKIFKGMSLIWTALRVLSFFIFLDTSSRLTHESLNVGDITDSHDALVFTIFQNCFQYPNDSFSAKGLTFSHCV